MSGTGKMLWLLGAPLRALLVGVIGMYRLTLSGVLGGQCRFHPSCSAYAIESVRTHGAAKGTALAVWRVLRCSPLTAGGPDPVPPRRGHGQPSMPASYGRA